MATMKQKIVLKKLSENGGKLGKAMREAGYSEVTSKSPTKLTKSKGWKELMDQYFPEHELAKKQQELLSSKVLLQMHFPEDTSKTEIKKTIEEGGGKLIRTIVSEVTYPGKKGQDDITVVKQIAYYSVPNGMIQDKAIDKAYKLRGLYAAEKKEVTHKGFSLSALLNGEYEEDNE